MYRILSMTPPEATDGHVDLDYEDRSAWAEDSLGATVLGLLLGDEHCGPFVALSYVAPRDDQMPLSFAHAHASDNWRISVRGTTNMGRDAYEQGQWRFHDGGVPYASDNFAWGPEGGYGIIVFADRRGFAIEPVKASIAEKVKPQQDMTGQFLGIDMQSPCPGAPSIATTMGLTARAHLDGGFDGASTWDEVEPGVRMSVGIAGEPDAGPVFVFLDGDAGATLLGRRTLGSETLVAPIAGSVAAVDVTLRQGDVRIEEADTLQPDLVAGPDGAQLVAVFADRRALRAALEGGTIAGAVAVSLHDVLPKLQGDLASIGA